MVTFSTRLSPNYQVINRKLFTDDWKRSLSKFPSLSGRWWNQPVKRRANSPLSASAELQSKEGRGPGTHWLWGSRAPRKRCCPRRWGRWTTPAGWRALQTNTNSWNSLMLPALLQHHWGILLHPSCAQQCWNSVPPQHSTAGFWGAGTQNMWACSWPYPWHCLPEKLPLKENQDVKIHMVLQLKPANTSSFTSPHFLPWSSSGNVPC